MKKLNCNVSAGSVSIILIILTSVFSGCGKLKDEVKPKLYTIGKLFQGGQIAYILTRNDPGYDPLVPHGIIISNEDLLAGNLTTWGSVTAITNSRETIIGSGKRNTEKIKDIQTISGEGFPPANAAINYSAGGFNDWVLPSRDELTTIYSNLSQLNGFEYLSDVPEMFFWSSTELDDFSWPGFPGCCYAYATNFKNGDTIPLYKGPSGTIGKVRAIRYF
jgi:hypothetical protein